MILVAQASQWSMQMGDSVQHSLTELWIKLAGFVPNLIGMLAILVIGYLVSKLLQRLATAVLRRVHFDNAGEKTGLSDTLKTVGIRRTPSEIVGVLVFWLFMLTFLISAADALGLGNVSRTIDSFVTYLPNVIGAAVIVVVGLLLSNFVQTAVHAALQRIEFEYARPAAKLIYGMLLVVIGSLAVGQLRIETALINRVIEISLIAIGAALAIALGFGTRDIARHVVAGVYARECFKAGREVSVGDTHGTIEAVTAVNTKIRTSDDEIIHVPNAHLMETLVREKDKTQ